MPDNIKNNNNNNNCIIRFEDVVVSSPLLLLLLDVPVAGRCVTTVLSTPLDFFAMTMVFMI